MVNDQDKRNRNDWDRDDKVRRVKIKESQQQQLNK